MGEIKVKGNKRKIGFEYEEYTKKYLELKGLKYIESIFYSRFGEIYLIFFEEKTRTLIFIEVKYRRNNNYGEAVEFVTKSKMKKIYLTSEYYIDKIKWEENVRYDIVGISGYVNNFNINWIKNAF